MEVEEQSSSKKVRGESAAVADSADDTSKRDDTPVQEKETDDVKAVRKGVQEVELEDSKKETTPSSSQDSTPTPPPETQDASNTEPIEEGQKSHDSSIQSLPESTEDTEQEPDSIPENTSDSTGVESDLKQVESPTPSEVSTAVPTSEKRLDTVPVKKPVSKDVPPKDNADRKEVKTPKKKPKSRRAVTAEESSKTE